MYVYFGLQGVSIRVSRRRALCFATCVYPCVSLLSLVDKSDATMDENRRANQCQKVTQNRSQGYPGASKIDPESLAKSTSGRPKRPRGYKGRSGAFPMRPGSVPGAPGESQKMSP